MPQPSISAHSNRPALEIRSRHNARWKDFRQRLLHPARAEDGKIAIEGVHLAQEALRSGLRLETLFLREDTAALQQTFPANETYIVAKDIFNQGCATEAPQGVAALLQKPTTSLDQALRKANPLLVILDGIQDPGNLGTILRSAEAFGASGLLLLPGTVSPWNQKAMRASAGSVFRVPLIQIDDVTTLSQLRAQKIPIYAAVAQDGIDVADISKVTLDGPAALLIGNEGAGISAAALAFAERKIQIACIGPVESLNAGVAASILLYAAAQQRKSNAQRPGVQL
jgi:TrmH family RNA methyltransferase